MKLKRSISVLLLMVFVTVLTLPVFACEEENPGGNSAFKDVKQNHWAYNAISWMAKKKIISGNGDGTFKPDGAITRAQFAKIMVLALNLPMNETGNSSFKDVKKGGWEYKFVDAAKYYLTGFRTPDGDYFRPEYNAVREDMAVALVKALELQEEEVDESVLDDFKDSDKISPKLKRYVAIAVKHEILKGYPTNDGMKEFAPQNMLTRAQAAVLLYNAIQGTEEKVTYEDEKVTYDEEESDGTEPSAPVVKGDIDEGNVELGWSKAEEEGFKYYKVVVSKYDSSPRYPEDGYLYYISDINDTEVTINIEDEYNGGDFGGRLKPGETYYFSITTVYEDGKFAGNAVELTIPEE